MKICADHSISQFQWVNNDYVTDSSEELWDGGYVEGISAEIRLEAQRKVIAATGSGASPQDAAAWVPKQLNAIMEFCGIMLARLKEIHPTGDYARADQLAQMKVAVDAIRARSNQLEQAIRCGQSINVRQGSINGSGNWMTIDE